MPAERSGAVTRLAIFGGSFNPPHLAHRMLMSAVLDTDIVDAVWMIPTFRHAFGKDLAPYADRVAMCERVAAPLQGAVTVSLLERELGGESRTLPLLQRVGELLPGAQLRLLIGADILLEAHNWHRWDEVVRLAPPLIFGRGSSSANRGEGEDEVAIIMPDISSTEIRRRLAGGEDVRALLPASVVRYIDVRGLYRGP